MHCLAEFDRLYKDILERAEKLKEPEPEPKKSFFSSWFGKEEIKSKRNNVKINDVLFFFYLNLNLWIIL